MRKDIYKKYIKYILATLLFAVFLTACGGKETKETDNTKKESQEDTNNAGEKETESTSDEGAENDNSNSTNQGKIDLSTVTLRFASTGWASQQELLKAAGLDDTPYKVEYSTFQGGNLCLEAMAANQIDLTGSSEIPPLFASQAENGGNFKIIAVNNSNTQNQEVIVPKGSKIKSINDLKGKKVGYIKSTTAQYFLYEMLKNSGLSWGDIDAIEITTADGVTALLGGQIDAFASYGNSINAAKANGAATLASAEDILSGNFPYEASLEALKDDAKRAAIADYLGRIEKANEWAKEHITDWAKISADPTGVTYEENLKTLQDGYAQRDTHVLTISDEIKNSEQNVADAFNEVGLIETKIDVTSLYDDSLSDAIKAAIDQYSK